jgi:hypothetical protein
MRMIFQRSGARISMTTPHSSPTFFLDALRLGSPGGAAKLGDLTVDTSLVSAFEKVTGDMPNG